jgi:hypothetical protein
MANINNDVMYKQKEREFKALGARIDRFKEDYVDCVNDVIAYVNLNADLETAVGEIANTEGEIGFDNLYRYPFSQLLSLRLFVQGQRPTKGGEQFYADLKRDEQDYVDQFRQGIVNAATAADEDDDTTSIIGLGALG